MSASVVKIKVYGIVQGVGFRYFTRRQAQKYGLNGWVRNLPDGSVEACAGGGRDDLERLIADLRRGPAGARVDDLQIEWRDEDLTADGFSITY